MTDHEFSAEEVEQARHVLINADHTQMDACIKVAMDLARQTRSSLVHAAMNLNSILREPPGAAADAIERLTRPRRKIIVVAAFYQQAAEYLRMIDAQPGTHLIAMEPHMVRALGKDDRVIVISDFDPNGRLGAYTNYLKISQADVTYVSLDALKGVDRDQ